MSPGERDPIVPYRFELSSLVRHSVATLCSHLVTRPTGQALRLGIESQIDELGAVCVSVLDFTEVVVLDYSCADETVAKLLRRFQRKDRPTDAYFVARGLGDHHHEMIEAVLQRHGLALVVDGPHGAALLGRVPALERRAWRLLESVGTGDPADLAAVAEDDDPEHALAAAMEALAERRVVARTAAPRSYVALSSFLPADGAPRSASPDP